MTPLSALSAGLLVGVSIAAPVGPMSLLCIQRTLSFGMRVGVSTGLGAATVNLGYGLVILIGLGEAEPWLDGGRRILTALGGMFLLWVAFRSMRAKQVAAERRDVAPPSLLGAYGSAVMFNASNPMALVLILAFLSPTIAIHPLSPRGTAALLTGMFTAAAAWWVFLAGAVSLLRSHLTPAMLRGANRLAAMLLTLYGAAALVRSLGP